MSRALSAAPVNVAAFLLSSSRLSISTAPVRTTFRSTGHGWKRTNGVANGRTTAPSGMSLYRHPGCNHEAAPPQARIGRLSRQRHRPSGQPPILGALLHPGRHLASTQGIPWRARMVRHPISVMAFHAAACWSRLHISAKSAMRWPGFSFRTREAPRVSLDHDFAREVRDDREPEPDEIAEERRRLDERDAAAIIQAVACPACPADRGEQCFPGTNAAHYQRAASYARLLLHRARHLAGSDDPA